MYSTIIISVQYNIISVQKIIISAQYNFNICTAVCHGYVYEEELLYDTFPDGFLWGTATAAYQVHNTM